MKPITAENIKEFAPTYLGYAARRNQIVEKLGVTSEEDLKDFRAVLEQINEESKIGLSKKERNILALMLTEEEANIRFNQNIFIHPNFGGNTGSHPIFGCLKIDSVRDEAGFGPTHFADLDGNRKLAAAKLFQSLYTKFLLHDAGELIDISYTEQKATGATYKEPKEEALVGPFKILLAAYAISQRNPSLYIAKMHYARERITKVKQTLYDKAITGEITEITGNKFVDDVGKEIGEIIEEITASLSISDEDLETALRPEYAEAKDNLTDVFNSTQDKENVLEAIFKMFDKLEGDSHFRHFAGRGTTEHTEETPLMERLYNNGEALSYHLASSKDVIKGITYAQRTIADALTMVAKMPRGEERYVAEATARTCAAALLRNHIRLLQKSPPVIDVSEEDNSTAKPSIKPDEQQAAFNERLQEAFDKRLQIVSNLSNKWVSQTRGNRTFPITKIEGIVDTKTLIAVLDKAATAIENGSYTPKKNDLPIALGDLPPQLHVGYADIRRCSAKYPLEVKTAYRGDGITI